MPKFKIPVSWMMVADVEVEAKDLDAAYAAAKAIDLPDDGEYCDGSFEINTELIDAMPDVYGEQK